MLHGLPKNGEFIFPNSRDDGPMKNLGACWAQLRRLASLDDVRVHDLRHTYASHAEMNGLDLYIVGRLLGHADVATTERYAHLADDHVHKAAGKISRVVNNALADTRQEADDEAG